MKPFFIFALSLLLIPVVALAQAASLPTELPLDQALELAVKAIGGLKGASALGIALALTQIVMVFFRTKLADFAGKWKFVIASGVSMISAFLGLLYSGVDWKLALMHGVTMSAVSVFLHQLVKQFTEKSATN